MNPWPRPYQGRALPLSYCGSSLAGQTVVRTRNARPLCRLSAARFRSVRRNDGLRLHLTGSGRIVANAWVIVNKTNEDRSYKLDDPQVGLRLHRTVFAGSGDMTAREVCTRRNGHARNSPGCSVFRAVSIPSIRFRTSPCAGNHSQSIFPRRRPARPRNTHFPQPSVYHPSDSISPSDMERDERAHDAGASAHSFYLAVRRSEGFALGVVCRLLHFIGMCLPLSGSATRRRIPQDSPRCGRMVGFATSHLRMPVHFSCCALQSWGSLLTGGARTFPA